MTYIMSMAKPTIAYEKVINSRATTAFGNKDSMVRTTCGETLTLNITINPAAMKKIMKNE